MCALPSLHLHHVHCASSPQCASRAQRKLNINKTHTHAHMCGKLAHYQRTDIMLCVLSYIQWHNTESICTGYIHMLAGATSVYHTILASKHTES